MSNYREAVNDSVTVAGNLTYMLIIFVLLWLAGYNGYSIDGMRHRSASVNRP